MSAAQIMTMRDAFIGTLCDRMAADHSIFFLAADLGAPALDRMRSEFPERFINVGIAEQNLINVASGLALEGFNVYTYAIAPFITMRAYEQARVNLAVSSQIRPVKVTMLGLGGGVSYVVSGPTHHCLEDLAIMRLLPNMSVYCPADWVTAGALVDHTRSTNGPAYIRFDGKALPALYAEPATVNLPRGFSQLVQGTATCLVSTGFMTHRALAVAQQRPGVAVIDLYSLKPCDEQALATALRPYNRVISMEEGFINNGGLDSLVAKVIREHELPCRQESVGFNDRYVFDLGSRDHLHGINGMDEAAVIALIDRQRSI
ncbi:transketolase family protein [Trichlorobacter lovleyi]|uniref:transketolase family protein n=1 Tax=Trichlorobacter lovleyi TaxID=313985 RepID=UPI0023F0140B|nr:transketolase C-terminal domain-containing protein [Trichlorobacter lovleyi]